MNITYVYIYVYVCTCLCLHIHTYSPTHILTSTYIYEYNIYVFIPTGYFCKSRTLWPIKGLPRPRARKLAQNSGDDK